MSHSHKEFVPLNVAVLTVSDSRTLETDSSGQYLVEQLQQSGHQVVERALLQDNLYQIRARVAQWIANDEIQVILTTGGTGFTERDSTPEAIGCLLDRRIDGFGELFRHVSLADIGASTIQSRAFAGFSNRTLVCCMPGSTGACRTAWEHILAHQLDARQGPCNMVPHLLPVADCNTRG